MVRAIGIKYSDGYILSGAFVVDSKYQGKILQVRWEGSSGWSDIGRILSNGQAGFKYKMYIGKPQNVEVRIFNGAILGEVYLG